MPHSVEVEIMGQSFALTSEDGEEHVRRVAGFVDGKMREMAAGGRITSSFTVAVMTALNIASEYQKLRDEHARMEKAIDRLSARLTTQIRE